MALDSEFFCPVIRGWEVRDSEMGQGLHRTGREGLWSLLATYPHPLWTHPLFYLSLRCVNRLPLFCPSLCSETLQIHLL